MQSVVGHLGQTRPAVRHEGIKIEHGHRIFAAKLLHRRVRRVDARRFRLIGNMRHEREDSARRARQRVEHRAEVLRKGKSRSARPQKIVEAAVDDIAQRGAARRFMQLNRHIGKACAAAREIERRKRPR